MWHQTSKFTSLNLSSPFWTIQIIIIHTSQACCRGLMIIHSVGCILWAVVVYWYFPFVFLATTHKMLFPLFFIMSVGHTFRIFLVARTRLTLKKMIGREINLSYSGVHLPQCLASLLRYDGTNVWRVLATVTSSHLSKTFQNTLLYPLSFMKNISDKERKKDPERSHWLVPPQAAPPCWKNRTKVCQGKSSILCRDKIQKLVVMKYSNIFLKCLKVNLSFLVLNFFSQQIILFVMS